MPAQWPAPRRALQVEVLARDAQPVPPSEPVPPSDDGGEVISRDGTVARIARHASSDSRDELRRLVDGVAPPVTSCPKPLPPLPLGASGAAHLRAPLVSLRADDVAARVDVVSKQLVGDRAPFAEAVTRFSGVPAAPRLSELPAALDDALRAVDPAGAKELGERAARATAALAALLAQPPAPPAAVERDQAVWQQFDAGVQRLTVVDSLLDDLYVAQMRAASLRPIHEAALRNFAAVSDAVNAAHTTRQVAVAVDSALKQLEVTVTANGAATDAACDDLQRRIAALQKRLEMKQACE